MRFTKGFFMALGMFCSIPLPFKSWHEDCTDLMLPCYPLVGAVIGTLWFLAARLLVFCGISPVLSAAVIAVLPFLLTGFLHLDGYMDTSDAILSRRPYEDKLRILKDSNVGAFSVIMLAILFLLQYASVYATLENGKLLAPIGFIPVITRGCTAAAMLSLKTMTQSGYGNMMKAGTGTVHKIFPAIITAAGFLLAWYTSDISGLITAAASAAGVLLAIAYTYRQFRGLSGDLAGFALVIGELCGLIALAVL